MVIDMPTPAMGAEDFSYVLQERPGALAFLGVCPEGQPPRHAHSCHSNRMVMNEDGMQTGIAMHAAMALSYFAAHPK
jgi:hippurate hydrolase